MSVARLRVAGDGPLARRLAPLVEAATDCLEANVVPGRTAAEPARYLRAGGGYPDPWIRDAAINAWQAASWLAPEEAGDTLAMVCEEGVVVEDDQSWDSIIWVVGAREQAMVTGDPDWARRGLDIGVATLARLDERYRDPACGLYRGPAVMADGITGYPPEMHDPSRAGDSFVLDHPAARRVFSLSTNCLYVHALRGLADLAAACGDDPRPWRQRASDLAQHVRAAFWLPQGRFGYLLVDGTLTAEQEGLGIALAVLSGVATPHQAQTTIAGVRHTAFGLPAVWPPFADVPRDRFGRHGAALWPMIMGVWAQAVAHAGDAVAFGRELDRLCTLFERSDGRFFELYSPTTGDPDGGWQAGRDWRSEPDQTWSATTFLGTVLHGLAGLRATPAGLEVHPCRPPGSDSLTLSVPWRGATLDLTLDDHRPALLEGDPA